MASTISIRQLSRAASAYRALLRAQRVTFKGDDYALQAAHQQTRLLFSQFVPSCASLLGSKSTLTTDQPSTSSTPKTPVGPVTSEQFDEYIQSAFEIASYLRKNVVQGVKTEAGNYALRFTAETELGDNDTIKAPSLREARPLRPPLRESIDNSGVKRRRRASKSEPESETAVTSEVEPSKIIGIP